MELAVEVDSRENCICSLNRDDLANKKLAFALHTDSGAVLSLKEDANVMIGHIRLSKDFAKCLGIIHGSKVLVTPLETEPLKRLTPIVVSPVSVDDWEVIESQAVLLESSILSQVNALSEGMRFPIWTARGHHPIMLQVTSKLAGEVHILGVDSELVVEARVRTSLEGLKPDQKRDYLRVRVRDTGFPSNRDKLSGVGLIVNTEDFISRFGASAGCLVTVRDRPDILTIVACDSSLVDPGVALISPCLRDMYGIRSGERIVLESQSSDFHSNLIIPRRLIIAFDKSVPERKRSHLFSEFVDRATCVIAPQGGYLDISSGTDPMYIRLNFDSKVPTSKCAAIITPKQLLKDTILTFTDLDDEVRKLSIPEPFFKYLPESVKTDVVMSLDSRSMSDVCPIPSYEPIVARIVQYIDSSFVHANPSLPFVGSLLVESTHQKCGKTALVSQALLRLDPPVPVVRVDCAALSCADQFKLSDVEATLSGLIRFAFESPPMILFLDDVDQLIVDRDEENSEREMRAGRRGKILADLLCQLLYDLRPNRSIFLIGTAVTDSALLSRIFIHKERLPFRLTSADRNALAKGLEDSYGEQYSFMELVEIARTGRDNRGIRRRLGAGERKEIVQSTNPRKLGGLTNQTRSLVDAISMPLQFPFLFQGDAAKSLVSSGALVVGPSGCGKSALVDHVVHVVGLPVEIVRGPDLLDKYIGASEMAVRKVFEKAASIAPCVVVFDTIDALCPRRGSESTGVTDRVVNQMLCYLDGVEKVENVFVIAITSRPDMVDPALTRPGRLDLVVVCDMPSCEEKEEIISALWEEFAEDLPSSPDFIESLASDLNPNCTGADIKAAFVNAKIQASRTGISISTELLQRCMQEIKPSISEKETLVNKSILARYKGEKECIPEKVGTRIMLR
jgi:SpoVK/Ycf46/Vps4 family AAA+-type ATPase